MKSSKSIALLFPGLLLISVFFLLPQNMKWLRQTVLSYASDFGWQRNRLSLEDRRSSRYGQAYTGSKIIAGFFEGKADPDRLVLVPPEGYFKKYHISYPVPEPAVFYYFTGLKTTWASSPEAAKANWLVTVKDGQMVVDSVTSKTDLLDSIASFNHYPYPL